MVATGIRDNKGEGGNDVFVCHFDNQGEVTLEETLGSIENDKANHSASHPLKPALFFTGYHKGYGVETSGNAFVGGILFQNLESLFTGSCEVPRVLWVDYFTWHNGLGGIDLNSYILGTSAEENDLISFATDNNITYLAIYGLNFIFEPNYQSNPLTQQAKVKLSNFIAKCRNNNPSIAVGLISTTKEAVYTNATSYNEDVANNASQFNYSQHGKISFFVLEHEFWNASRINAFSGNTSYPAYDNEDGAQNTTNDVPDNLLNDHFTNCYNDHETILTSLQSNNNQDANILGVHDYINHFYFRWSPPAGFTNNFTNTNTSSQQSKATALELLSDGMFLVYYQPFSVSEVGEDFLSTNASNPSIRFENVFDWQNRLKYLGQQTNTYTNIFPLFSSEYYYSNSNFCGDGGATNYLGKHLEGTPSNGIGTLNSVENNYQTQHNVLYNDLTNYPNIQNIDVSALSWYKYSCIETKVFSNSSLLECQSFNIPLHLTYETPKNEIQLNIYPNPSSGQINITSDYKITLVIVYSIMGKKVLSIDNPTYPVQIESAPGVYIANFKFINGENKTIKLIIE